VGGVPDPANVPRFSRGALRMPPRAAGETFIEVLDFRHVLCG
jgi:hypothetical protein